MATRAACYAGYAFLLLANILSYHATTAFASVPSFDDGTYMPVLGATHAAAFVAVALRYRNVAHEPLGSKAAGFAAVALCIGFALVPGSCSAGVQPGFVAGTVLIGVGQAVLSLLWLSALPMFSYRTSYLFLLGSHAAATALCAIVLQYPQEWYIPITLASLLAACACATRLRVARPIERTFSSQIADVAPLVGKGVLAVGLFALLSGFVTSLSGQPDIDPDLMQYLVLGISACVLVIMSVPALLFRQPFKLEGSYRVALPLSALGLLVLPGLTEAVPPAIAGTLATTGYMMCGIVLACTIAEVGKAARIPVMPLYAASDTVSLLCLLAGTEAGALTRVYLPGTNAGFALIGLGTLYLVMLGASWLLGRERIPRRSDPQPSPPPEQDARPSGGAASEPADATRLASAPIQIVAAPEPDLVAAAYGLSDLETTVFKQLLEGRTIARIAQDLYLSPERREIPYAEDLPSLRRAYPCGTGGLHAPASLGRRRARALHGRVVARKPRFYTRNRGFRATMRRRRRPAGISAPRGHPREPVRALSPPTRPDRPRASNARAAGPRGNGGRHRARSRRLGEHREDVYEARVPEARRPLQAGHHRPVPRGVADSARCPSSSPYPPSAG